MNGAVLKLVVDNTQHYSQKAESERTERRYMGGHSQVDC